MRVSVSVKYHADQRNRVHVEPVLGALEGPGRRCVCVVRDTLREVWGQVAFYAQLGRAL
jgi:hypothetical protein